VVSQLRPAGRGKRLWSTPGVSITTARPRMMAGLGIKGFGFLREGLNCMASGSMPRNGSQLVCYTEIAIYAEVIAPPALGRHVRLTLKKASPPAPSLHTKMAQQAAVGEIMTAVSRGGAAAGRCASEMSALLCGGSSALALRELRACMSQLFLMGKVHVCRASRLRSCGWHVWPDCPVLGQATPVQHRPHRWPLPHAATTIHL
jgi:hypothetical protein